MLFTNPIQNCSIKSTDSHNKWHTEWHTGFRGKPMAVITDTKAKNIKPGDKPIPHGSMTGLALHPSSKRGRGKWVLRFLSPLFIQQLLIIKKAGSVPLN
jgi:hypothetical protein